jgi:guanylate kinase
VINADVEKCLAEIQAILAAERLKLRRQIGLTEFTAALLA